MKRLIIIDGHYFLWRSYSVPFTFTSKKGTPLHVCTMYLKLLRRVVESITNISTHDKIIVVFDTDTTNSNLELSQEYKSNRKSFSHGEESPYAHIQYVQKILDFLKITHLEIGGFEADDIVASVSKDFCGKDNKNKVVIVSADTDFYQLLHTQVSVLNLKKGSEYEYVTPKCVKERLGVYPNQYVAYKSLVGDPADNIKGVQGIGKITAKKIINKEVVFDYVRHKDILELNTKLITLNANCKKEWDFRKCAFNHVLLDFSNHYIFDKCDF